VSAHSIFNTHFSSSSSKAALSADRPEGTGDPDLPPWVEALVFIRRFGDGQGAPGAPPPWTASCVYPPEALPASVLADVLSVALPRRPILRGKDAAASSEQSRDGTGSAVGSQQEATDTIELLETLPRQMCCWTETALRWGLRWVGTRSFGTALSSTANECWPRLQQRQGWTCFICESLVLVTRWPVAVQVSSGSRDWMWSV